MFEQRRRPVEPLQQSLAEVGDPVEPRCGPASFEHMPARQAQIRATTPMIRFSASHKQAEQSIYRQALAQRAMGDLSAA